MALYVLAHHELYMGYSYHAEGAEETSITTSPRGWHTFSHTSIWRVDKQPKK